MVLDPKHFDDMDDFGDFEDKLDTTEGDFSEAGPNHPLSWRRLIIEKAVNNVKKAQENRADIKGAYKKGELLFDSESHKFGRVVESSPGFLNLSLISGGKIIRQDMDNKHFISENRQKLTLPQLAEKLAISEIEVIDILNHLELDAEQKVKTVIKAQKADPKKKVATKANTKKPLLKANLKKANNAPKFKMAPKKDIGKKTESKEPLISFTKLLPKGATTDPIVDPNGYIQQNFLLMSNRELSFATGLSEHTIRRKLGEWNLKRKDFVNKA